MAARQIWGVRGMGIGAEPTGRLGEASLHSIHGPSITQDLTSVLDLAHPGGLFVLNLLA